MILSEDSVERLYIESLMRRREAGEKLTENEETAIAYSVYGTAASCSCYSN